MSNVRFTIKQLEYFVATAQAGSFAAAAKLCHVSHVGISFSITELERTLGVQLLVRRRAKGVALTPEGKRALIEARSVLELAGYLQSNAEEGASAMSGILRLGYHPGLGTLLLPEILDVFSRAHPQIQIEVYEGTQPDIQRKLVAGDLEVALLYDRGLRDDIEAQVVHSMTPHVLLSSDHPLAGNDRVSLADLNHEPLIRLEIPVMLDDEFGAGFPAARSDDWFRTTNFELVRCLVGRGLGYAVLAQRPAENLTYDGYSVVARSILEEIPSISVVLAQARGSRPTHRVQALYDFCASTWS